ncbi:MAG: hypothetical protein MZU97_24085 [Bacillus subtilis]|nr:hypothetical protein [Bacillus subtilis]
MKQMRESVAGFKQQYVYYQQLYAQYGLNFPYPTVNDYSYVQLGAKTEAEMLQYFVRGALQPHFIKAMIERLDIVDLLFDTIEENYNNYFSLNITHLIIHFDFDENGQLDNYFDFLADLDEAGLDAHETLKAGFETAIREYLDASTSNSYSTLVSAYNNATREDTTWGVYKQAGFLLKTETLTQTSAYDNETSSNSIFYSGEYGVSGSYVSEYVDALIALYQEYRLDQNAGLAKLEKPAHRNRIRSPSPRCDQRQQVRPTERQIRRSEPQSPRLCRRHRKRERHAHAPTIANLRRIRLPRSRL